MSRRRIALRRAVAIGAAVAAITASVWHGSARAGTTPVAPAVTPVVLNGEGSWDINEEFNDWANALYGKSGALTVNYLADGGYLGRQDYIAGEADYVVSGVGFTPSQLKSLPGGAGDLIEAPIMPSAVGFLFQPPIGDFNVVNNDTGQVVQHYTGPYNIPLANISAMMLDYAGQDPASGRLDDSYEEWDNPAITKTWPGLERRAGDVLAAADFIAVGPQQYGRSDPNETTYYLQKTILAAATSVWDEALQSDGDTKPPTSRQVTETLPPYVPDQTKAGMELEVGALLANNGSQATNGSVADVPPSAMAQVEAFNANQKGQKLATVKVDWLGVPNKRGQYLDPTPATIDASIDAGGATPLYAMSHDITGGYPLTYIDDLYAPAHGLSQTRTEAIATLIRYLVTAGQSVPALFNDGRLSPALVAQALKAADKLVESNCRQKGEEVVASTNPGPYAPDLPALKSIGKMDNCVLASTIPTTTTTSTTSTTSTTTTPGSTTTTIAAATTTTATPPTTTAATAAPTTPEPTTGPTTPTTAGPRTRSRHTRKATATPTSQPGAAATTTVPSTPPTTAPKRAVSDAAVLASSDLEGPGPGAGGFDHLAALLLGAALFLLCRRPARRLLRRLRS